MRSPIRDLVLFVSLASLLAGCPRRVGSAELTPESRELVSQARQHVETGRPEAALELLQALPAPEQENEEIAPVLFLVAEQFFQENRWQQACDAYRDLLLRFPLFDQADRAKYHLGLALLELGDPREALQVLTPLYGRLPAADKPRAARALYEAANGSRAWADAARWSLERAHLARDPATRQAALDQATELLDRRVPFQDVARLAEDTPRSSPAWPVLQFKLAKVYAHLRDRSRTVEALEELLEHAPQSPYSAEARALLEAARRKQQVRPQVVGAVLPLSGKYRAFGETVLSGVRLALNGSSIQLVTRDSAGDPVQARQAVAELANQEQVIAIIGPVLSAESEDAAAEAELEQVPIITLTFAEKVTRFGPHVFRNMLTNSAQAKALADYAMNVRGFKRFAVLYPDIPYGNELMHQFWDEVEARGGEIRGIESYPADQTTFGPTVKKLVGRYYLDQRDDYMARRRAIVDSVKNPFRQRKLLEEARKKLEPIIDFEALFVPDYFRNVGLVAPALAVEDVVTNGCDPSEVQRFARATGKRPEEVRTVQLLGANGWNFDELVERGGRFVQCSVLVDGFFVRSERPRTRAFVEEYRKAYNNRDPALLSANGFDTAKIVRHIIETDRPATREAFLKSLRNLKDFPGVTGTTRFREDGEVEKPLFLLTITPEGIREVTEEPSS